MKSGEAVVGRLLLPLSRATRATRALSLSLSRALALALSARAHLERVRLVDRVLRALDRQALAHLDHAARHRVLHVRWVGA